MKRNLLLERINEREKLWSPEEYPGMTVSDRKRLFELNCKNHFAFSVDDLKRLCRQHRKARESGDEVFTEYEGIYFVEGDFI